MTPKRPSSARLRDSSLASEYAVLVSSCDAYADCWPPFFTLLAKHWQGAVPPIVLNTETQTYEFPGCDIRSPRVQLGANRQLSWSERLLRCLDSIPYEILLYLQEDYFIKEDVDTEMLNSLVTLMKRDGLSHISLVPDGRAALPSTYEFLDQIDQRAEYRITAQAGLWRVSTLKSYLRRHESVWEFEWYGTRRAWRRHDSFFYVNGAYERWRGGQVVPYDGTGVVHGRWSRGIVEPLFQRHGIDVDFRHRGFYEGPHHIRKRSPRLIRAARRLRSAR